MAFEKLIKRTIWEAECPTCHDKEVKIDNAPRERHCTTCDVWIPYVENSVIGPDLS